MAETRITIDLDTKNKLKVLFVVGKALYKIKKIKEIQIIKSHSGNHHLIIWSNYGYTERQQFHFRKILNDDKFRLHKDLNRSFGKNTLFYKKEPLKDFLKRTDKIK